MSDYVDLNHPAGEGGFSPEWADQRQAPRFTPLIRTAKLIGTSGEYLCVVRDASSTGISVRTFHPLPEDTNLTLEMPNGDRHELQRVWETEGKAGFAFVGPVDIDRLIVGKSRFPKRPLRLRLQLPALVSFHGETAGVVILDISQQGARIACSQHLAIDQPLRLEADCLPVISAKVRWRKNGAYGLVFTDTLKFGDLASVAAEIQAPIKR
ncbi:PilZ domain-containing protein [Altericroceibacterium endophyticum]|uniref:PilZ domain-containing protein n=1 Tax=Altericroceibacterium endophyticum TaxID=1808508 RepID=A0A6I4T6D3_9SPHN|nr:PilZ domain-containing protein [Altericroceibacterium endophyticum]MXO65782.1 PilZ domain-containing protein [Altericroceibacterium endophyticum]